MYFSQFTASFLRCGANVIGLCPSPREALASLRLAVDPGTAARLDERVHFHRLTGWDFSLLSGHLGNDPARTFARWKQAADCLEEAEVACGFQADLAYFPYLDCYLRFLPISGIPSLLLNRPWSGLYLRNHHHGERPSFKKSLRLLAKGDPLMRSNLCRGIGVLDERFIPEMEKFSSAPITPYPDVTQTGLAEHPFPLTEEVVRKAAGRKIIGIIGLERRKGFLTMIRTAALAREAGLSCYFVCTGSLILQQFTDEEQAEIKSLATGIASGEIQNVHLDLEAKRIPCEGDYNSLFSTFDVAWAAYENFEGSSGTLSKAAVFEIPCIATAGECVGRRVERYRLGINIPEGSAKDAVAAIPHLLAGEDAAGKPLSPDFSAYRDDHSQARLDRILGELLQSV